MTDTIRPGSENYFSSEEKITPIFLYGDHALQLSQRQDEAVLLATHRGKQVFRLDITPQTNFSKAIVSAAEALQRTEEGFTFTAAATTRRRMARALRQPNTLIAQSRFVGESNSSIVVYEVTDGGRHHWELLVYRGGKVILAKALNSPKAVWDCLRDKGEIEGSSQFYRHTTQNYVRRGYTEYFSLRVGSIEGSLSWVDDAASRSAPTHGVYGEVVTVSGELLASSLMPTEEAFDSAVRSILVLVKRFSWRRESEEGLKSLSRSIQLILDEEDKS